MGGGKKKNLFCTTSGCGLLLEPRNDQGGSAVQPKCPLTTRGGNWTLEKENPARSGKPEHLPPGGASSSVTKYETGIKGTEPSFHNKKKVSE